MIPFARLLKYGNVIIDEPTKYLGIISDTDLSYNDYVSILSPSAALIAKQGTFRSYRFRNEGTELIIPSQPIAYTSYKEVYEKGMVWGTDDTGPDIFDVSSGVSLTVQNAVTTIDGSTYRIRLMRGTPGYTLASTTINNPDYTPLTEWELYVYSIYNNLPSGYIPGYTIPLGDQIERPIYSSSTTRRWALVQGSDGNRTTPRCIGRGRFDTFSAAGEYQFSQVTSASVSPLWTSTQNVWWPILEKI